MRRITAALCLALATACTPIPPAPGTPAPGTPAPGPTVQRPAPGQTLTPRQAAQAFVGVVRRMEPVAEAECRARARAQNCDFLILVDDRPAQPPNAFQTLDRTGRPVIVFTLALIADARNADELAFVLGHEAAHHVAGHIPRTQQSAAAGALIAGALASIGGASATTVDTAQRLGATVGARRFSQEFELEADALGTIIAARAGYDPLRGAEFFARIPDPGNRFLGTHPPNAARMETVRRTVAGF